MTVATAAIEKVMTTTMEAPLVPQCSLLMMELAAIGGSCDTVSLGLLYVCTGEDDKNVM